MQDQRPAEKPDKKYQELHRLKNKFTGPQHEAMRELITAFRDENFSHKLKRVKPSDTPQDVTVDLVKHEIVDLSEYCEVEMMYVGRAQEKEIPKAAKRAIAVQHVACLNLPHADEKPTEASDEHQLAELVDIAADSLWKVLKDFQVAHEGGHTEEVKASTVWGQLVWQNPDIQHADSTPLANTVTLEWFEKDVDSKQVPKQGTVTQDYIDQKGLFEPFNSDSDRSAWELGRFCTATVKELGRTPDGTEYVRLEAFSPLLHRLLYSDRFRDLALVGANTAKHVQHSCKLKRCFAAPLCGSRGKGGAQNHALMLLKNRRLLRGKRDPEKSKRGLFTILDARHQPKPDYYEKVLPWFFRHKEKEDEGAGTGAVADETGQSQSRYKLDHRVAFAQAPQAFADLEETEDTLDTTNGMMFNMLNNVRNSCGAVTSCGTNCTWQLLESDQLTDDFFDARTKIEDTASSHKAFLRGCRSLYVNDKCVIGVAKRSARYLGAVARWSEGAVQLFWVTLFDRGGSIRTVVFMNVFFVLSIYGVLVLCTVRPKEVLFFCTDVEKGICKELFEFIFTWDPLGTTIPFVEGAVLMTAVMAFYWFCFGVMQCIYGAAVVARRIVMMDNLTYFWSSNSPFFWVFLNCYMVFTGGLPFKYEILEWMAWLISIKILQYILLYTMKSKGDCTELAIWRSQQMFFVTAPLHQLSIINGTKTGFRIIFRAGDLSFWDTDNADQVLFLVKIWLTLIMGVTLVAVLGVIFAGIHSRYNSNVSLINDAMRAATLILVLLAICVFDAFLDVWELTAKITKVAEEKWKPPEPGCWNRFRWRLCEGWSRFLKFFLRARSKEWVFRWFMDLGLPILIVLFVSQQSFAMAAAFSMLVRM